MTKFYVVCVDEGGARERLDWTYDEAEATRWLGEYAAEDDQCREHGAPVPAYTYEVEEEVEEDDDEEDSGYRSMTQEYRDRGLRAGDFY